MKTKMIILFLLALLNSGCFMVFAVGNNDFEINDSDTAKTRDINAQADTKVTPIP